MNTQDIQADIDKLRATAHALAVKNEDRIANGYFNAANALADVIGDRLHGKEYRGFTQRGQHINKDYEPFATVSGQTESESVHWTWNLTRWLNNGWVTEADVEANSVNGLILKSEYTALEQIMDSRPADEVKV